jgi:subtilase family serine protease
LVRIVYFAVFLFAFVNGPGRAQTNVPARITQAVDPKQTLVPRGNTHPLARPEYDRGLVADAQPLNRMLLLLQRSPDQEAALQQFLEDQQNKLSPNYHRWLTPEQFGKQYGPADADIQAVTDWLLSQGFTQVKVGRGRTAIEFSGNVAQVRNALQTEIRHYTVNGQAHMANATDPHIPAALAPVVAGVVSLHNFPVKSHVHHLGTFQKSIKTGEIKPLFTFPGCQSGNCYALGPPDFAVIYNTLPLLNGTPKIDGTGQTIAVVGETNINVQDVSDFRTIFGLAQNFTTQNVILNGPDPGINGSETESDLDIQWAGAVAPGATIDFVTSAPTETTSGVHLSALYAVDNNLAGVLSESFGECEQFLGTAGNQFYNSLWQQAAAQGITVILSSGDGGSAGCDNFDTQQTANLGLAVSGFASTPFNVAVGGTDFDQIGRESQFWITTPTTTTPPVPASVLKYIPEVPWNDTCAQLGLSGCGASTNFPLNIVAGSGGASSVYAKPSWQMGYPGVPNDSHRDLPDVSLFASNGFNGSFYIICQRDITNVGSCNLNELSFTFQGLGGTSASAPAFAGIMALVNQKMGSRQGNANYVLYALAKGPGASCNSNASTPPASTCTFNDVTKGNNSVPCAGGTPNCSSKIAGINGVLVETTSPSTPAFPATAAYDLATGLGSVNAQNLVNNWNTARTVPTTTALTLNSGNSVNVTHGAAVPVSIAVTPAAATGEVALVGGPNGISRALGSFTLSGGNASGSTTSLVGGTYAVTAHYAGDGTNAPSDSPGVQVTVASENSQTFIVVPTFDSNGNLTNGNASTMTYGTPSIIGMYVTNASATANPSGPPSPLCAQVNQLTCPTGSVLLTGNGAAVDGGTFGLNGAGYTRDVVPTLTGGTYSLVAQYSGDNSYNASSATIPFTVTPATTNLLEQTIFGNQIAGQPFPLQVLGYTQALRGIAPTGTVTFFDGNVQLGSPFSVIGGCGPCQPAFIANPNLTIATAGSHTLTAHYSGDTNYAASSTSIKVTLLNPTSASISVNPTTIKYGNPVTITAVFDTTVSASNTALKPSGNVGLFASYDGAIVNPSITQMADGSGNWEIQVTATITPQSSESITVNYAGDSNYAGSTSSTGIIVTIPDFSLGPANGLSLLPVAGQVASGQVTITPAGPIPSTVNLYLVAPVISGYTITLNPQQVSLNGAPATATISFSPVSSTSASVILNVMRHAGLLNSQAGKYWTISLASGLASCFLFLFPLGRKRKRALCCLSLVCLLTFALGCGGGSSASPSSGTSGAGAGGGATASAAPTSITLSTSNARVSQNQPFLITATVTSSKPLTGNVTFYNFGSPIAGFPISNGQAQVGGPGYINNPGLYQITATYGGDVNNQSSTSSALTQVITGTMPGTLQARTGGDIHSLQVNFGVQ